MRHASKRCIAVTLLAVLAYAGCSDTNGPAQPDAPWGSTGATRTRIGAPQWAIGSVHLFMQPASNFATEIVPTLFKLFPAPFHKQHPVLLVGPGVAHAGPYANESDAPFAAAGLHDAYVFHMGDWDTLGMYLNWLVYAADSTVTGSSPDFASGPIIPNARFKTNWSGGIYHRDGGILIQRNPYAVCNLTDTACLDPLAAGNETWPTVDGASHYPNFGLQTKRTTAPLWPQVGDWEWRWTGVDASGAGWTLTVPFTVLP